MIITILIPVSVLLEYREFDRVKHPAPLIPFMHSTTVGELTEDIRINGLKKNLELSILNDSFALLTEGNHRISALHQLGIETCCVDVVRYSSETVNDYLYEHTVKRFKPIGYDLKPYLIKA